MTTHLPLVLLTLAVMMIAASAAPAQGIPRTISYQGVLTDAFGELYPDGNVTLAISLYETAAGGSAIFTESHPVTVVNGVFNAIIGSRTALPASLKFDRAYFLGVSIDGSPELAPRTALTAVPYALRASVAGMAESLSPSVTGVVTSINGRSGGLTLRGGGATLVSRSNDTITITSVGSGDGGVGGVQNIDGSLEITNPTGPVVTAGIAANGVTEAHIANGAVTSAKLADGAVTNAKLADNAVSTAKIEDAAITDAKLADNAVGTAKIEDGAITQQKLDADVSFPPTGDAGGDLAGTYPDPTIADNVITSTKIADGTIVGDDIDPAIFLKASGAIVTGDVSIGTTSSNARLEVKGANQSGTSAALRVADGADNPLLYVANDGKVGIGTSTPAVMLDVVGGIQSGAGLTVTAGAAVLSTAGVNAGAAVLIPAATSVVRIIDDGLVGPNTVIMPGGVAGQFMIIFNDDAQAATGPGLAIASGQARMFVFMAGAWRLVN